MLAFNRFLNLQYISPLESLTEMLVLVMIAGGTRFAASSYYKERMGTAELLLKMANGGLLMRS